MRFTMPILANVLALTLTFAKADNYQVYLQGLDEKPHFKGLDKSDLALDLLLPYASSDMKSTNDNKDNQLNQTEMHEQSIAEQAKLKKDLAQKERPQQETSEMTQDRDLQFKKRKHPKVQSSAAYCSRSVDRLKNGPANIPCLTSTYVDTDFSGTEQIWWSDYNNYNSYYNYQSLLGSGYFYFADWPSIYPDANIFDPDGTIHFNESIQGSAGTCYLMASMGSIGEFPDVVRDVYVTKAKNDVGAIMVRFFIRGKPWVVSVDNSMLFKFQGDNAQAVFAKAAGDEKAMWAAIVEKAWAKVKGNYLIADGGLSENGLTALTGCPVFRYQTSDITDSTKVEETYQRLLAADAAHYMMTAGTAGSGNDQVQNSCGIAESHAYSILAAFSMTDASGTVHKCLLMRNPWGTCYYNQDWNKDDPNWTDALVAQVPFGVDVRTQQATEGLFVVPIDKFQGTACFSDYQIAHNRASEGFKDTWYDKDNAIDDYYYKYTYTVDQLNPSDLYFTVQTYLHSIIPNACTTGTISTGQSANYPVAYIAIYDSSNTRVAALFYFDQFHRPIVISQADAVASGTYTIWVNYEFLGSPHPDFTLKVYSKSSNMIYEQQTWESSMIHMDGQLPSGFLNSQYTGMQNYVCSNSQPVEEEEQDIKDIPVKSLVDVFKKSATMGEFFEFLWYNPWVAFVWIHFW